MSQQIQWRRRTRRRPVVRRNAPVPQVRSRGLLTPAELAFHRALVRALPNSVAVSLKTRLADIVDCPDELWYQPLGRRIAQKHVDFTLYDPASGKVLAVLELDDRSHASDARKRRDLFVDQVLDEIGVPLLRIRCAAFYQLRSLAADLTLVLATARRVIVTR